MQSHEFSHHLEQLTPYVNEFECVCRQCGTEFHILNDEGVELHQQGLILIVSLTKHQDTAAWICRQLRAISMSLWKRSQRSELKVSLVFYLIFCRRCQYIFMDQLEACCQCTNPLKFPVPNP